MAPGKRSAATLAAILVAGLSLDACTTTARGPAGSRAARVSASKRAALANANSAAAMLSSTLNWAGQQRSFSYAISTSSVDGARTATSDSLGWASSSGKGDERQVETATGSPTCHAEYKLVGTTSYLRANAACLESVGLSPSQAAVMVGRWIALQSTDGTLYSQASANLTVRGWLPELSLVGPLSESVTGSTVSISGHAPTSLGLSKAKAVLTVTAGSRHLPVRLVITASEHGTTLRIVMSFSGWDTTRTVAAPQGAVPYSQIKSKL